MKKYWAKLKNDTYTFIECDDDCKIESDYEYKEISDDLFDKGFDGGFYLKTFLKNPSADYITRKQEFDNQKIINECRDYLNSTDYVISKLNELKLEDEDEYETEKAKYTEVLAKRKECRKTISELQKEN